MTSEAIITTHFKNVILSGRKTSPQLMPFFHVCTSYVFRSIFHGLKLEPQQCNVFEEPLVYFFYGKPAYKINGGDNISDPSMDPVCWGINPTGINNISGIYPFDSGAFKADRYSGLIANHFKLEDFKFDNSLEFIQRFISYFYENNENYFHSQPSVTDTAIPPMAYEILALLRLLKIPDKKCDDRAYTIEVHTRDAIDISTGDIKILGIPSTLMNDQSVANFIFENDINFFTYDPHRFAPSAISALFYQKTRELYISEGVIKK